MTTKPHDAIFKAAFEQPEHAAALFRANLPAAIVDTIAWATMVHVAGSFVATDLFDYHSDLLFSVETRDHVRRYLLLEHQSTLDTAMPLRVFFYIGLTWVRHYKQNTGLIPPVLPLLVSHATSGWTAPRVLHDVLALHPSTTVELTPLVPNFQMVVDDLAHQTNEELDARALPAFPKLTLWLLRDARHARRLLDNLPFWARRFREALLAPHGIESVHALVRYITLVNEHVSWEEFRATIHQHAPEAEEATMTIAEQLIAEGRAKGRTEGRAEGLHKQLTLKFGEVPLEYQARLVNASLVELDVWIERVLSATSIAEVFDESPSSVRPL
jgi:predicted transposase YdaD